MLIRFFTKLNDRYFTTSKKLITKAKFMDIICSKQYAFKRYVVLLVMFKIAKFMIASIIAAILRKLRALNCKRAVSLKY